MVPLWGYHSGPSPFTAAGSKVVDRENILRVETVDVQRLPAPRMASWGPGLKAPAWLRLRDGSAWRAWQEGKCPILGKPSL